MIWGMWRSVARMTPARVTELSAALNLLLSTLKIGVGRACGSTALTADGVHSFSDLFADALCWASVQIGARPPDESHPQGYGRYEHIGSICIASIVSTTGIALAMASVGEFLQALALSSAAAHAAASTP